MMNQAVSYEDKQTTLISIQILKVRELAHYLVGKTKNLEFVNLVMGFRGLNLKKLGKKFSRFYIPIGKN